MSECREDWSRKGAFSRQCPKMPDNARFFPRRGVGMIGFRVNWKGDGIGNIFVSHLNENGGAASS
jgi:hypothetical protein